MRSVISGAVAGVSIVLLYFLSQSPDVPAIASLPFWYCFSAALSASVVYLSAACVDECLLRPRVHRRPMRRSLWQMVEVVCGALLIPLCGLYLLVLVAGIPERNRFASGIFWVHFVAFWFLAAYLLHLFVYMSDVAEHLEAIGHGPVPPVEGEPDLQPPPPSRDRIMDRSERDQVSRISFRPEPPSPAYSTTASWADSDLASGPIAPPELLGPSPSISPSHSVLVETYQQRRPSLDAELGLAEEGAGAGGVGGIEGERKRPPHHRRSLAMMTLPPAVLLVDSPSERTEPAISQDQEGTGSSPHLASVSQDTKHDMEHGDTFSSSASEASSLCDAHGGDGCVTFEKDGVFHTMPRSDDLVVSPTGTRAFNAYCWWRHEQRRWRLRRTQSAFDVRSPAAYRSPIPGLRRRNGPPIHLQPEEIRYVRTRFRHPEHPAEWKDAPVYSYAANASTASTTQAQVREELERTTRLLGAQQPTYPQRAPGYAGPNRAVREWPPFYCKERVRFGSYEPSTPSRKPKRLDDRCGICLEPLLVYSMRSIEEHLHPNDTKAFQLPCKHHFHGSCVQPWLAEKGTCPLCRQGL